MYGTYLQDLFFQWFALDHVWPVFSLTLFGAWTWLDGSEIKAGASTVQTGRKQFFSRKPQSCYVLLGLARPCTLQSHMLSIPKAPKDILFLYSCVPTLEYPNCSESVLCTNGLPSLYAVEASTISCEAQLGVQYALIAGLSPAILSPFCSVSAKAAESTAELKARWFVTNVHRME